MKNIAIWLLLLTATIPVFGQYSSPESAIYDEIGERWLISNVGSQRILQRTLDNNITPFATNLGSPKGLMIVGDTLYVADETRIRAYRLSTRNSIFTLNVPNSTNLNDLAADDRYLYVTEMTRNKIYRMELASREISEWVTDGLTNPNGIYVDRENERLIVVSFRANSPIQSVALGNGAVGLIANTQLNNLDGIARDGNGNWYISSWGTGAVYRYKSNFTDPAQLQSGFEGPADIYYDLVHNVLAIPCMSAHQVVFRPTPPPEAQLRTMNEVEFGEVFTGTSGVDDVVWENSGGDTLVIDSVTYSVPGFRVENQRNIRLGPGRQVNVTFFFEPVEEGEQSDVVRVYSNEPMSPREITVHGIGVPAATIDVTQSLDFGGVWTERTEERSLVVFSTGLEVLRVDSTLSELPEFRIVLPEVLVIEPGDSMELTGTFTPVLNRLYQGNVWIYSNDPESPHPVNFSGFGIIGPRLIGAPERLIFGEVMQGDSTSRSLTITNGGELELVIDSLTSGSGQYSGVGLAGRILRSEESVEGSILFKPAGANGPRLDTLLIYSNDQRSPYRLAVAGFAGLGVTEVRLPTEFSISEVYPAPFNSRALIQVSLPSKVRIVANIFDGNGRFVREVVSGEFEAGIQRIEIPGEGLANGRYFLKGRAGENDFVREMVFLK